jgi:hypothetical protein
MNKIVAKIIEIVAGLLVLWALYLGNWAMAAFFVACELHWEYKGDKIRMDEIIDEANRVAREKKAQQENPGA